MTMDDLKPVTADENAGRWGGWLVYGIIAAVVAIVVLMVWKTNNAEPTATETRDDAKRACQEEFIPKRLKAPATAQFTAVSVTVASETYTVKGAVDSQNGFGALVRSQFSCVMHSSGDTWVLDSASVS